MDQRGAVGCAGQLQQLVLMDIRMPKLNGIEATQQLQAEPKPPRVLVLTTFDLDRYVLDALVAGAAGYLLKDASPQEIIDAVRTVAAGQSMLAPSGIRRRSSKSAWRSARSINWSGWEASSRESWSVRLRSVRKPAALPCMPRSSASSSMRSLRGERLTRCLLNLKRPAFSATPTSYHFVPSDPNAQHAH